MNHNATSELHPLSPGIKAMEAAAFTYEPKIAKPDKHLATEGEKKFDSRTYFWVNYVVNSVISLVAAVWVDRTHSGQNMMKNFVGWMGKTTGADPEMAQLLASKSFFLSGGFAVLAPVKWMEDGKVEWVKQKNREIYGDRANTDPEIIKSEHELELAPKQSWASVFSARGLALIPFYIFTGAMWDRKGALSRMTNPELGAMSKEAIQAMEKTDPSAFSTIANKGFYLDRPIAAVSRIFGKMTAKLTGNDAALKQISEMEKTYPGMVKNDVPAMARDPNHSAFPYYFITEATLSGMVAASMYGISRITGPFFGQSKPDHVIQTKDAQSQALANQYIEIK